MTNKLFTEKNRFTLEDDSSFNNFLVYSSNGSPIKERRYDAGNGGKSTHSHHSEDMRTWFPGQTGWEILSWFEFLQKQTLQVVDQKVAGWGEWDRKQANKSRVVRPLPARAPNTASQSKARLPPSEKFILRQLLGAPSKGINSLEFPTRPLCSQSQKKRKKASGRGLQVWAVSRFLKWRWRPRTWLSTERTTVIPWLVSVSLFGRSFLSSVARGCGPCRVYLVHDPPSHLRGEQCGDCPLAETAWGGCGPFSAALRLWGTRQDSWKLRQPKFFVVWIQELFGRRIPSNTQSEAENFFCSHFAIPCMHTSGSLPDTIPKPNLLLCILTPGFSPPT